MKFKIKVLSKVRTIKVNGKDRKITDYYTPCNIVVTGEESKGKQRKCITVKFRKEIDLPKNFRFGLFELDTEKQHANPPTKYEIKVKEDGTKEYPVLWIRGYDKLTVLKPKVDYSTVEFDSDVDDAETSDIEIAEDSDIEEAE